MASWWTACARRSKTEYEPGDLLPSERELSEDYCISRTTVRLALKELETLGFIKRRHGKGTFVADRSQETTNLTRAYSFSEQMRSLGRIPRSELLEFRSGEASKTVADRMGLAAGERVILNAPPAPCRRRPHAHRAYLPAWQDLLGPDV